ncbi:MAG TPA: ATP-dependent Clp protease ATP-binding subunit ClpX, partial [Candidatus Sumerlaeota bacterium]|nr:ATP-dependent Clp protease ATP-binding subunit ClpX [Candidatus Sumerlaeota bacterium]
FGADIKSREDSDQSKILEQVTYQDLLQFGFIPEFIGRLPVFSTLDNLGEQELKRILSEPRNSIIRQYQKFFEMEEVDLVFTPDALDAIARKALKAKTGARGLRSIIESIMLDITYDLPTKAPEISEVRITVEVVEGKAEPEYVLVPKSKLA